MHSFAPRAHVQHMTLSAPDVQTRCSSRNAGPSSIVLTMECDRICTRRPAQVQTSRQRQRRSGRSSEAGTTETEADAEAARVLGVSVAADGTEVRKAYRRRALACHPDKVGGDGREFKRMGEAYARLASAKAEGRAAAATRVGDALEELDAARREAEEAQAALGAERASVEDEMRRAEAAMATAREAAAKARMPIWRRTVNGLSTASTAMAALWGRHARKERRLREREAAARGSTLQARAVRRREQRRLARAARQASERERAAAQLREAECRARRHEDEMRQRAAAEAERLSVEVSRRAVAKARHEVSARYRVQAPAAMWSGVYYFKGERREGRKRSAGAGSGSCAYVPCEIMQVNGDPMDSKGIARGQVGMTVRVESEATADFFVSWMAFDGRYEYGTQRLRCRLEPRGWEDVIATDEGESDGGVEAEMGAGEARALMRRAQRLVIEAARVRREAAQSEAMAEGAAEEASVGEGAAGAEYRGRRRVGDARLGPEARAEWMAAWGRGAVEANSPASLAGRRSVQP